MQFNIRKYIVGATLSIAALSFSPAFSQEIIQIEPLFEYPVAPEELPTMAEKSNYLVEYFWDSFDYKRKTSVDQNALNHAFKVFTVPMRYADKEKSVAAVEKIITQISKNPTMLLQFTKAAEENMYGPRAEFWVDEVYLKFLEAIVKNKKVSETRKSKYETQYNVLRNTLVDGYAPMFKFTDRRGKEATYFPMSTPTLIIIGNPKDADWRMTRVRMESNIPLTQEIDKGKVNIIFIVDSEMSDWEKETEGYSPKWTVGIAPDIKKTLDIRISPSAYVVGTDGKIVAKNIPVLPAAGQLLRLLNN